jgi:hypothetical protein
MIALHGRRRRVLLLEIGAYSTVAPEACRFLGDGGAGLTDDVVQFGEHDPVAMRSLDHLVGAEAGEVAASLRQYLRGAITNPRSQGSFDTLDGID